jgi:hypothetical protein
MKATRSGKVGKPRHCEERSDEAIFKEALINPSLRETK